ncbi:MAG: DEAD/DEAH box helicase [Gammaproteobacteria bacterium]|jgi:superfamily II DNA/RNA helicase|nr:DEAD/DEAH box helicase [Gammaproteobacteria bacterium]
MTQFKDFGLPAFVEQSLERMQITVPTPIQTQSIPVALAGKDILASAQTGTGKTIAYLLPVISKLVDCAHATALILAPTRELADQIRAALTQILGRNAHSDIALLIGGAPIFKQFMALKKNPRFIIGTPGRINDHLMRGTLNLRNTRFLILDETDRMLDMGFSEALEKIAKHLPTERQTMMFSATMPANIIKLSQKYLNNPQHISIGETTKAAAKIDQKTLQTSSNDKFPNLLKELESREGSVIIFVRTKISAAQLAEKLRRQDHSADAIHGDLKQRQRDEVIRAFRNQKSRIMVATDIAARGLDIPHIMHVINYDLPQCPEDYIHRIGRTGRAGMEGHALSFIGPGENRKWQAIYQHVNHGKASETGGYQHKPRSGGGKENPRRRRYGAPSTGGPRRSNAEGTGGPRRSNAEGTGGPRRSNAEGTGGPRRANGEGAGRRNHKEGGGQRRTYEGKPASQRNQRDTRD